MLHSILKIVENNYTYSSKLTRLFKFTLYTIEHIHNTKDDV